MSDQPENNEPTPLQPKRGFRLPTINPSVTALFILAVISAWMLSGEIVVGGSDTDKVLPIAQADSKKTSNATKKLFAVRARLFTSRPRKEILHIRARSEADIRVEIRAETSGRVEKIKGKKGQLVKRGTVLCQLDIGAREATLLQAQAFVAQTESDYLASVKLARRGFSAKLNVNTKKAAFNGAKAAVKKARIDLDNTRIKAPFTGLIEERPAKVGDYLPVGTPCAKLVKLHPLLVVGEVSERNVNKLTVGQKGRATLVTGETVHGRVRFISPSAKVATRTFRIELEVDNKNQHIRNGVTADIFIPLKATVGHLISPAYLTLSDAGEVGVRSVGKDKIVRFRPVKILDQGKYGVWITGLPKKVVIITVGHDYVIDGQKVDVVMGKANDPKHTSKSGA